ncbi:nitrate reductase cytochrome c-type subunit [Ruegeria pomeroyi]|uniref:Periplasmic nitrate reductase, electron transfer subunit n=1 Tax=Ruegeria alba TaxID=2916756 RepID=A0ABS9P2L1_9RHOB|nr:nitrate reductase cytochrome c-type subunit [Ruegeria alba]MCE8511890.1 nitrate reductase cytochrome c-type subunit [Ruegeria pomeroyi]MCE8520481.1 nitrate reductase cytochrome c-type subunit [Ruegeria pomeroyi]MCE8524970.1 nitrate reductase cytochrome c-type subunit [Ruegeria pomeroyi]MCE8528495.1 nitrate reductase cytochrome c-type subunit [Ruegeria pomeroyi]MCE8533089.1 nitrate reductase cytochrome c-type subunit [Ruegeria pomeroyi]
MKFPAIAGISALATTLLISGLVAAQNTSPVQTLRGADINATLPADEIHRQMEGREARNYRQQPPLIPHSTDQYQIDLRANQCLSCHDWTNAGERGAPTLSMTHYLDRNGTQLDTVAGTRWFCNQCHVPQANAPALVGNTFKPSNSSN